MSLSTGVSFWNQATSGHVTEFHEWFSFFGDGTGISVLINFKTMATFCMLTARKSIARSTGQFSPIVI